jgi:predicted transcriptional regulator
VTVFTKNRNTAQRPEDYDFWYRPDGDQTKLTFTKVNLEDKLLEIIRRKPKTTQEAMATELGVNQSTVFWLLDKMEAFGKIEWNERQRRYREKLYA